MHQRLENKTRNVHTHTCLRLGSFVTLYLQQSTWFQDITSCRFFVPLISFLRVVCLLDFFLSSEILHDQAVLYRQFHKTSCSICAPCGLCCAKSVSPSANFRCVNCDVRLNKGVGRCCISNIVLFWLWVLLSEMLTLQLLCFTQYIWEKLKCRSNKLPAWQSYRRSHKDCRLTELQCY